MDKILFAAPDVGWHEAALVRKAIKSRWLTNGPVVHDFERKIAEMSGASRAVCCDSCSNAMETTLRMLGVGSGDEVITTPFTYTSTAEVILHLGAKAVFVDLDEDSFEMDYQKVADAITPHTKAIMPVDYGGKLCDYAELMSVVKEHKDMFQPNSQLQEVLGRIAIIADAAHSFGAKLGNKVSGQFADFTCFSFHVLKNITTGGEGGAIVWNDIRGISNGILESNLRLLLDHGQTSRDKSGGWEYDIKLLGYNSIMTNLDAAMGLAQLDRFEEITEDRVEVTHRYDMLFDQADIGAVPLIRHFGPDYMSAMHLYPIRLYDGESPAGHRFRNTVYHLLKDAGVPCNVHYKPLPMMSAYKALGYKASDYPNASKRYYSLLTIPYHTFLSAEQQEYIVDKIGEAVFLA